MDSNNNGELTRPESANSQHKASLRPHAAAGYLRVESMVRHHTTKSHSNYHADFKVKSPNVKYTDEYIESKYVYQTTAVQEHDDGTYTVEPRQVDYNFRTERKVPKLGVMLVGWGGNNGSTVTAAIYANKHHVQWTSKDGIHEPDYFGSLTQSSTVGLGRNYETNQEVYVPLKSLVPMVDPNDIVLDGWDISSFNLADAMERAQVLEWDLQKKLRPYMEGLKPRPSIFDVDFVASNQQDRADNIIKGTKWEQVERIRSDIRDFKSKNKLDSVILLWTANTERYSDVAPGLNDTAENLLRSIKSNAREVSPSTLFAVASILEGVTYINGSPQNTFVPGCLELAQKHQVFISGDDFKSGQTKLKSVLVDFLISAGLKPVSIVSYNHLGNNDGKNLSAPKTFRSKEISKSNVVDDMVESNPILYEPGEHPDHCIVIKYIPYVGDSKRAMDEYTSEIMMGGRNTLVIHNTCEDSLLASPLILDLIILAEICQRITFKVDSDPEGYQRMHSVLSFLSYLCKAPLVPPGTPVVNALFKQRTCIENILKACIGLPPDNSMLMEFKESRQIARQLMQVSHGMKSLSVGGGADAAQQQQQENGTIGDGLNNENHASDGLDGNLMKKVGDVMHRAQDVVNGLTEGAAQAPTQQ